MNIIAWVIVGCEISFWVFILLGLIARYIFGWTKAGLFLLALTPVVDLVLLIVTATDLAGGATATVAHSIAPLYIGISIAFGKSMIQWADERFVYYIKRQGPKPIRKTGFAHARHSLKGSFQHLLAYIIGAPLLLVTIYWINAPERTGELEITLKYWTIILGIDFLISISYFIWPRAAKHK